MEVETQVTRTDFDERGDEYCTNFAVLALLDCSKAFDRMYRPLLIQRLIEYGVHGLLLGSLIGYFFNREQRVRVGDSLSDFIVTRNGGPQGSVITLFCWLLYVNTICLNRGDSAAA